MSNERNPTAVERVAGHVTTESALTLVGVLSDFPLAALLPVLSKSIASERHRKRVEAALADIRDILEKHEECVQRLTDEQYKVINETILALLQTTNAEKLGYLRRAVRNAIGMSDLQAQDAAVLSLVIRDISADEAAFVVQNFSYERVQLGSSTSPPDPGVLRIEHDSTAALVVTGLIALGLLIPAGPTFDDSGVMRFSNAVAKLLSLLREPTT